MKQRTTIPGSWFDDSRLDFTLDVDPRNTIDVTTTGRWAMDPDSPSAQRRAARCQRQARRAAAELAAIRRRA